MDAGKEVDLEIKAEKSVLLDFIAMLWYGGHKNVPDPDRNWTPVIQLLLYWLYSQNVLFDGRIYFVSFVEHMVGSLNKVKFK